MSVLSGREQPWTDNHLLSKIGHRIQTNQIWRLVPHGVLISRIMCIISTVGSGNGLSPQPLLTENETMGLNGKMNVVKYPSACLNIQ